MSKNLYQLLGHAVYYLSKPWQWFFLSRYPRSYVVIEHEGRVLVVLNWLGKGEWSLPGGGIHKDENPVTGAVREVFEETSIRLEKSTLKKTASGFTRHFFGGKNFSIYHVKLHEKADVNRRKYEILDARWVTRSELAAMRVNEEVRVANLV